MRYFDPREEYSYEKRGKNWYGFCDSGCKVIVRPDKRSLVAAMNHHHAAHHGQMSLTYADTSPAPDDGTIPF